MEDNVEILGVKINNLTFQEALSRIESFLESDQANLIVTPNPEMIIRANYDRQLKEILNSAELALADGVGLLLAAKMLGTELKERITGVGLVQRLLKLGSQRGLRFYFLGAEPGIAAQAKKNLQQQYPQLMIKTHHGYLDRKLEEKVIAEIEANQIDVLLVGMGVPLQEKWLNKHLTSLQVPVGIGVGGVFDVLAGKKKRAPVVMQKFGLEWFFRLLQEPSRAGRMVAIPEFVLKVLRQRLKNK
ncbi:WecB/TagA/CpsF family glycosyltransferase [Natroniella sulfidigena]|uniref:WecB/TagA/CpsF family glycosyltransferase n=1 Tax=Natroniella sulfidigena TaxID=723921 RepID=UPI00200B3A71|nr:WecB/TagA/CpsF family glycosyltransferase [Natroniella sulfidigena]MCK8816001.1 WecB/TagA/CpsF family glycosyltransferase [Natroniella sulfidigena]